MLTDTLYSDASGRLNQLIDQARARVEELHMSAAKLLADANTTNGAALEAEHWLGVLVEEHDERKRLEERAESRDADKEELRDATIRRIDRITSLP